MSTRPSALAGDRALVRAYGRALDLARALANDLDLDGDRVLEESRAGLLARDLVDARALESARALADDLARAYALDLDLDRARALARDRDRAYALADDLDRVYARGRALDRARALAGALDRAHDLATGRGHLEREVRRVAPPAARLLAVVARLLPAADRARYDEEFRSELWDLAQAGAGRLRQVAYALRQLRRARLTAGVLRSPRRRKAAP